MSRGHSAEPARQQRRQRLEWLMVLIVTMLVIALLLAGLWSSA